MFVIFTNLINSTGILRSLIWDIMYCLFDLDLMVECKKNGDLVDFDF